MADEGEWLELELYQHQETDRALFLSADGFDKHWIPKAFVRSAGTLRGAKIRGEGDIWRGTFEVAEFKARECGLVVDESEADGQGKLF